MNPFMKKIMSARWAMRCEDVCVLASSNTKWSYDKEQEMWTKKKADGESSQKNNITRRPDGIAVIHVDGALSYRSNMFTEFFDEDTYNSIEAAFDECLADKKVKGIVFDINSPGGQVDGCADLGNKIFGARGSKPYGIVARTGGMMCSAAYWLGSSCEKVYCSDNGTLGSIGVLCSFTKYSEDIVKENVVVSDLSPNKNADPETKEGLKVLKDELNALAAVFINTVARNRGTTYEDVLENYGKGGCFVGEDAVKAGLADGVISLDALCEQMTKGSNSNGGGVMATNVKKAETEPAGSAQAVDLDAIKAEAVKSYKARVASISEAFAGLTGITAEEQTNFIEDESKTAADVNAFALSKAKEMISAQAEGIKKISAERDDFKAKAEAAPAADANLSDAQKLAIQKGLEKDASAANAVEGGAQASEESESKAIRAAFARGLN